MAAPPHASTISEPTSGSAPTVTATVPVAGDTVIEPDEFFVVRIGNPRSGGSVDPLADFAVGLIVNDDAASGDDIFRDGFE